LEQAAMLAHAEPSSLQMSRWGSWCSKQGHAPRLPALKPHHQHAQAQAPSRTISMCKHKHPAAAAAAATRRAPAAVTEFR